MSEPRITHKDLPRKQEFHDRYGELLAYALAGGKRAVAYGDDKAYCAPADATRLGLYDSDFGIAKLDQDGGSQVPLAELLANSGADYDWYASQRHRHWLVAVPPGIELGHKSSFNLGGGVFGEIRYDIPTLIYDPDRYLEFVRRPGKRFATHESLFDFLWPGRGAGERRNDDGHSYQGQLARECFMTALRGDDMAEFERKARRDGLDDVQLAYMVKSAILRTDRLLAISMPHVRARYSLQGRRDYVRNAYGALAAVRCFETMDRDYCDASAKTLAAVARRYGARIRPTGMRDILARLESEGLVQSVGVTKWAETLWTGKRSLERWTTRRSLT